MQLVHPIKPEDCRSLTGMYVCAVMQDSNRHYGILSRTDRGKLYLNEEVSGGDNLSSPFKNAGANRKSKTVTKAKSKTKGKKKAHISKKALAKQTLEMANEQTSHMGDLYDNNTFPELYSYEQPASYSPLGDRVVLDLAKVSYLFPVML
jgi:hypothetical protein